jgi:uncharacterized protein Yka (UPF0111/DUF47 family)
MDPMSALGLAANIVAFVEFAAKLVSGAHQVYSSATGATDENASLETVVNDIQAMTRGLSSNTGPAATPDQIALRDLAQKCCSLSEDLVKALRKLRMKNPKSKTESVRVAWRAMREKNNLNSLEKQIDSYHRQILARIVAMMR